MQGPSHAIVSTSAWPSPGVGASKHPQARSSTPAARPRHPACAAATRVPPASHSSTGRQSATMTVQAMPRCRVVEASATYDSDVRASNSTSSVPCTCSMKHRPRRHRLAQPRAVPRHRVGQVADMGAQVEAAVEADRFTAGTGGAQGPHRRRRRPVRHQPVRVEPDQASASGQREGCARAKASSCMQASKAAMVRGRPLKSQSKRWPLKICGTRQQSASVGVSPQQ